MTLSQKQLKNVCLSQDRSSRTCRYLEARHTGMQCMKLRPEAKQIDEKVREFLLDCKKKGIDPYKQTAPIGDNCAGCLILKSIQVGEADR